MSVIAGVRSLKSAVRKLEAAAVERQKACAYCRYKREAWPLPKGRPAEPEEAATARCEFCRAKFTIGLPIKFPLHSYIVREQLSHTCERLYTDRSVHAFSIWVSSMMAILTLRRGLSGDGNGRQKPRRNFALENIKREHDRLLLRRHKRLRAKYGEPFPEHGEMVNSVVNRERGRASQHLHLEEFKGIYDQETHYLICAEMEKIRWGRVRPELESGITELRLEMERLLAEEERPVLVQRETEERRFKEEAEQEAHKRREPEPAPLNEEGMRVIDWSKVR